MCSLTWHACLKLFQKEDVMFLAIKEQNKTQLAVLSELSSKYEEFGIMYPTISQLAAIGLAAPIRSVNYERDFSTMNRSPCLSSSPLRDAEFVSSPS
eukprot:superscaffoldBa00007877_g22891